MRAITDDHAEQLDRLTQARLDYLTAEDALASANSEMDLAAYSHDRHYATVATTRRKFDDAMTDMRVAADTLHDAALDVAATWGANR